jgi:predicted RNA binding protein YcfA (HicA-like mRNA interferase family)
MGKHEKILLSILCGTKDSNISFSDLCSVLDNLGFNCRIKGDHFIYTKSDIEEIINIQPVGSQAKPYQVKQVRNLILKYVLGDELNV